MWMCFNIKSSVWKVLPNLMFSEVGPGDHYGVAAAFPP